MSVRNLKETEVKAGSDRDENADHALKEFESDNRPVMKRNQLSYEGHLGKDPAGLRI